MRRKALFVAVGLSVMLMACGSSDPNVRGADVAKVENAEEVATESVEDVADNHSDVMEPENVAESSEEAAPDSMPQEEVSAKAEPEASEPTLADMESYLLNKGVISGDRVRKAGEMVGAIDGVGYDECEIYLYDMNSESYQKVVNGEEIFIEGLESFGGFTFDAVNGSYALLVKGGGSELVDAFNSFE